ncbi:MAG: NADH:flavin oxidoreductase/NADH oxidase family protein [Polyangiales bacterium]
MRIAEPLRLPCGAVLPNRIAKAAMSEELAALRGYPSEPLERLYRTWAEGGTGLLVTGNVMIDPTHLESPRNVTLEKGRDLAPFRAWAKAGRVPGSHLWMQINHTGRQTPRFVNKEPVAPSAVPAVKLLKGFAHPRALREDEIPATIARYGEAAAMAREAGFTGVQIHGAHGYLCAQFLSPLTNLRTDAWGGSLENRARFLRETVKDVRRRVGADFPIGVKLNSADFQRGGFDETESMEVVRMLERDGVDLLEISGGNYENPAMFDLAESSRHREAYFLDYAKKVRKLSRIPLMVTGGFRSLSVMEEALASDALDVVGMARPLALEPDLPKRLFEGRSTGSTSVPRRFGVGHPNLEYFAEGGYYLAQMGRLARGLPANPELGSYRAMAAFVAQQVRDVLAARRGELHHAG